VIRARYDSSREVTIAFDPTVGLGQRERARGARRGRRVECRAAVRSARSCDRAHRASWLSAFDEQAWVTSSLGPAAALGVVIECVRKRAAREQPTAAKRSRSMPEGRADIRGTARGWGGRPAMIPAGLLLAKGLGQGRDEHDAIRHWT